jgi:hypothetical protein
MPSSPHPYLSRLLSTWAEHVPSFFVVVVPSSNCQNCGETIPIFKTLSSTIFRALRRLLVQHIRPWAQKYICLSIYIKSKLNWHYGFYLVFPSEMFLVISRSPPLTFHMLHFGRTTSPLMRLVVISNRLENLWSFVAVLPCLVLFDQKKLGLPSCQQADTGCS